MAEREVKIEVGGTHHGPVVLGGTIDNLVIHGSWPADRVTGFTDELAQAVGRRWRDEENLRRIQDPVPLPVRYRTAAEDLIDYWENIHRVPAGEHVPPLDLSGSLEEITEVYARVPSRRLVVLGRAGSGKTILTLRFVLDLLDRRGPGTAVPVVFSLGSWDPSAVPLKDWLISRLIRDYPGLAATGRNGRSLAAVLVEAALILPVLDGFDELGDGLHRIALQELSADPLMPMLLTSRIEEYRDAVAGTRGLSAAAAIELGDLTLDDLDGYLPRTSAKTAPGPGTAAGTTKWQHVLAMLRDNGGDPASAHLAAVLTTPLMVALARTVYSEDRDKYPTDLVDASKFGSVADLEEHFLSAFLQTVYEQQPGERRVGPAGSWNPRRSERWLRYIAAHLDRLQTRDLAWWQVAVTMRLRTRTLLVALLAGLAFGVVTGVGNVPVDLIATAHSVKFAFVRGVVVGTLHGLATGVTFGVAHLVADSREALKPLPVRVRLWGGPRWIREKLAARLALGMLLGSFVALVFVLIDQLLLPALHLDDGLGNGLLAGLLGFPLAIGLGVGVAFGLVGLLESPIDVRAAGSPSDLLRASRSNVTVHLLVWAFVIGPEFAVISGFISGPVRGIETGLVFAIESALGAGIGYGLSLTAWGQWVAVARIWLPLTGRLPWRVVAFLDDGCRRGVLRQSGAVYQFRHARLQDHLIRPPTPEGEGRRPGHGQPWTGNASSAVPIPGE